MEFLEAFARMADRLSLPPILLKKEVKFFFLYLCLKVNLEFIPLCFKLEALIANLN